MADQVPKRNRKSGVGSFDGGFMASENGNAPRKRRTSQAGSAPSREALLAAALELEKDSALLSLSHDIEAGNLHDLEQQYAHLVSLCGSPCSENGTGSSASSPGNTGCNNSDDELGEDEEDDDDDDGYGASLDCKLLAV